MKPEVNMKPHLGEGGLADLPKVEEGPAGERVLIVSASMGAGHDGAARELAHRLERRGCTTKTIDFLDCAKGVGPLIKWVYEFQLKAAPWSYEIIYRVFFKIPSLYEPLVRLTTRVAGRRIRKAAAEFSADSIVTTYPLASLALGFDRQRGKISVPVTTFVTDFAVHPLWVHPGVDLNLCVHTQPARKAAEATGRTSLAPGPLVPEKFGNKLPERSTSRKQFGIPEDAKAALLVAGSWGVGELEATFDEIVSSTDYVPVAICGNNRRLEAKLKTKGTGIILGWTDSMPALMASADVLIQNAGGLTCMEAFSAGVPVITYRPIPGHGIENAKEMERAGVAPYVHTLPDLVSLLNSLTPEQASRTAQAAKSCFAGDAAVTVLATIKRHKIEQALGLGEAAFAASGSATSERVTAGVHSGTGETSQGATITEISAEREHSARRRSRGKKAGRIGATTARRAGAVAAGAVLAYGGANVAINAAVAHGVDVASAAPGQKDAFVGVRLGPQSLEDPSTAPVLSSFGVSAIVGGQLAIREAALVTRLSESGISVENGGWDWDSGNHSLDYMIPDPFIAKSSSAIGKVVGEHPHFYVPTSGVNGFAIPAARLAHEQIVRATFGMNGSWHLPSQIKPGQIFVIDGRHLSSTMIQERLADIEQRATADGIKVAPLSSLR